MKTSMQPPASRTATSSIDGTRLLVATEGNPSPTRPERPGPGGAAVDVQLGVVRESGVLKLQDSTAIEGLR
jgi:hypothetical protein